MLLPEIYAMPLPLPDLLRTYGDLLRGQNGGLLRTLVWLAASVSLLVVLFIVGAAVQGVIRWLQRAAERRRLDPVPSPARESGIRPQR